MRQELEDARFRLEKEQEDSKTLRERAEREQDIEMFRERADNFEESFRQLRQAIQESSRKAVIDKFGPGPHEVEIEVNFPSDSEDKHWYIVVELAPLDQMPHTVHTFLEQVSRGLFNRGGYSFDHNGIHIVHGAPIPNHLTQRPEWEYPLERFDASGYGSVIIQEYSDQFPHEKYTLGMTGRPSGPGMYINVRDNTRLHGPGGYADDGQGDPCFGKVVKGHDVVDRLHRAAGELEAGDWKEMEEGPIAIRSIDIL